jgi:hypothetical protein
MRFYPYLRDSRRDDEPLQTCIESVVAGLGAASDPERPGMLLGKIQSGKTRAFLGVIARAFDSGYDIAVVLTKGTRTLAGQTVKRIARDFKPFIDSDDVIVFDIMEAPKPLTRAELRRKVIIVAKKEFRNLERIHAFFDDYPSLLSKKLLLVDDEADLASVRFVKKKGEGKVDQGAIANQIDSLRERCKTIAFLQVTATPYALYLQPDSYADADSAKGVFYPKRPAFTVLLPIHADYVGGDDYFGGHGQDDPRGYLLRVVADTEQDALRSADARQIRSDRVWSSANIEKLRESLMTFVVAVAVRRYQQQVLVQPAQKYSMIVHNDTQRSAHSWQDKTAKLIVTAFEQASEAGDPRLRSLFDVCFADLQASVGAAAGAMPSKSQCFADVKTLLEDGEVNIQTVNSDVELAPLLDPETAELRLRTKANLFIGGSILDRGITVPNLISFYYGRNPKRMQADTVLQHSRMYGARPRADLAVTRFYTSSGVHERLAQIHSMETALREALEKGGSDQGVVFIQTTSDGKVVPCAPGKLSLSDVVAVKPNGIILPVGFDTTLAIPLRQSVRLVDSLIPLGCLNTRKFVEIAAADATQIVKAIEPSLVLPKSSAFEWEAMHGLIRYLSGGAPGKVLVLAEDGRRLSKDKSGDRTGLSILGTAELRRLVLDVTRDAPALILLKQEGGAGLGWKGGPFWWPMLASPAQAKPCVFATKTAT